MNKLNFLIVCENAFLTAVSENLNLINVFDSIGTNKFPTVHSLFFIVAELETTIGEHSESLVIRSGNIEVARAQNNFVGDKHRWILRLSDIFFPQEGQYTVELFLDNEKIGSTSLNLTIGRKKTIA